MEGFGPETLHISEIDVCVNFENPVNKVPWEISGSLGANLKGVNIGGAFSVHRQPPTGSPVSPRLDDRLGAHKNFYLHPRQEDLGAPSELPPPASPRSSPRDFLR